MEFHTTVSGDSDAIHLCFVAGLRCNKHIVLRPLDVDYTVSCMPNVRLKASSIAIVLFTLTAPLTHPSIHVNWREVMLLLAVQGKSTINQLFYY